MRYFRVYLKGRYPVTNTALGEFVVIADDRKESAIGKNEEMYWLFIKDDKIIVSIESDQVYAIREEYVR